jgi:hypothetical protein
VADVALTLQFNQLPDALDGMARVGTESLRLHELSVRGEQIRFGLLFRGRFVTLRGTVAGDSMSGEARWGDSRDGWSARYRRPAVR